MTVVQTEWSDLPVFAPFFRFFVHFRFSFLFPLFDSITVRVDCINHLSPQSSARFSSSNWHLFGIDPFEVSRAVERAFFEAVTAIMERREAEGEIKIEKFLMHEY